MDFVRFWHATYQGIADPTRRAPMRLDRLQLVGTKPIWPGHPAHSLCMVRRDPFDLGPPQSVLTCSKPESNAEFAFFYSKEEPWLKKTHVRIVMNKKSFRSLGDTQQKVNFTLEQTNSDQSSL